MKHYQNIIVGFGKAGKTLAGSLAKHGEEVLVIEKDAEMYGGTCINVACLPTKNLITSAQKGMSYSAALTQKTQMVEKLRQKNFHKVADQPTAQVLNAQAEFLDNHTLKVTDESGEEQLTADRIFINTGSTPILPEIRGIRENSPRVFTSKTLLDQTTQIPRLAILGSGPIGLEFASMYANFGSAVTVIGKQSHILPAAEPEAAAQAQQDLIEDGVNFCLASELTEVAAQDGALSLQVQTASGQQEISADALLVATGRTPNIADLHLERTDLQIGNHGEIVVDQFLQTNVSGIWALGDVTGGPQFTYISLDDWRIVDNQLFGDQTRSKQNRPVHASSIFLRPAFSSVGQTEAQLKEAGIAYEVYQMQTAGIPKSQVLHETRGQYKVLVAATDHQILGATIYAEESYEVINLISLAMQYHIPAEGLRDQIYTHPTMAEAFNDLFAGL